MKKIAILLENMYDDKELIYPYYRMKEAGFHVDLIGAAKDEAYKSKHGLVMKSDYASRDVHANDYDGIIIPGGFSPDYMRRTKATVEFVKEFDEQKNL